MSLQLSTSTHGSGFPLLLLHGFAGDKSSWDGLVPQLAAFSKVVRVDLPGHAHAPLPTNLGEEGFFEVVDALAGCIPPPMDVAGYSQGARLALALALRHPQRIRRLILESGTPGLHSEELRQNRREEDEARATLLEREGVLAFMDSWEKLPLFATQARLPEKAKEALAQRRKAHPASGLAGALRCMGLGTQPNFWPLLGGLHLPTLLISGEEDTKFTTIAQQMLCALPLAWHVAIASCGHAIHLESPQQWLEAVSVFLKTSLEEQTRKGG
ncbi:MAG: 2-succinyl-6-hydroxy-2,4-cyclohexadiene-1-carboxylate synthase [Proteobacteria bacterium]|nr:2-succinyl-6-hydroxy-2,4-cyclohexadiene-1-carboxylate synthase [Cystobacterineae bacterium]MCL2258930.1 2-succinyl-6-hydroxy-2,4-cyclohexadiene-1-carboxylate synthase [Cystobacterineae bacterium]MCL2314756.1 2-succinyl-6-hydroxy-2,4-cyclohexadiene-1-carboxylate synthase [Pseudomonadota bacterium]